MKKRTTEVTPAATLSIASTSSGTSVSAAPSVTFAADIADKESTTRTGQAPPTELLRGAPRLARRRIDSITGSDKQRRLSRANLALDGSGAWREFPPSFYGEDPQELHAGVQRPFFRKRPKELFQVVQDPSHKPITGAPKKRGSKSISPFDHLRAKPSRAKEDIAVAMPSATPLPEAKEQNKSCSAGTGKAFPNSATAEATKSRSTLSNASTSSASSRQLGGVSDDGTAGMFSVRPDDVGGKDGRDVDGETRKSMQAVKSGIGGLCDRPPPRWLRLLLAVLVAVALTAVVLAFLVGLLLGGTNGTALVRVCHTHECHEYGRRLSGSLNTSVRPCDSFSHFVCDGWTRDNELGTYELLVAQGMDSVARTLDDVAVPLTGQSPFQRGVALYRSCDNLLRGHHDDLASVREALREAGITWPRRPARADVLHTILATSLRLGWDVLFRFVPLRSFRPRLAVNLGRTVAAVFNRKLASEFTHASRSREYFSELRSSMLPPDVGPDDDARAGVMDEVSFQEVAAIEELTTPLLSAAYYVPSAPHESAEHMRDNKEIGLSRARWATQLRLFGLDDAMALVTANPEYLLAFLDLWRSLGENTTHVFVSWYTVQVAALLANQNLIVNFYDGHSRRALSLHVAFCLGLAYAVSGPVIFSDYSRHVLRATVRQDAGRLLLGVREFFWKRLARWGGYDANVTVVDQWSSLDVVFRELGSSDHKRTGVGGPGNRDSRADAYATMDGAVPELTEVSLVLNLRKVSSSVTMEILGDYGFGDAEQSAISVSISEMRLLTMSRALHDFTLMPYALSFPHFDGQLPAAVSYAGLGAEVARALGVLVLDAYRAQPTSQIWLDDLTRCLSTSPFADNVAVDVAETLSLGAVVDAYEGVRADMDAAKLPGLERYTDLQLLFMALCFAKCRGSGSRKTPPSACNLPLMYSPQFVEAFGCAAGTPMNQVHRCTVM